MSMGSLKLNSQLSPICRNNDMYSPLIFDLILSHSLHTFSLPFVIYSTKRHIQREILVVKVFMVQGFDPYSTTCFRNTTHLVAIFGSMATNVIIGSDIRALWPPKLCVALVISSIARGRR